MKEVVRYDATYRRASFRPVRKGFELVVNRLKSKRLINGSYLLMHEIYHAQKVRIYTGINFSAIPFSWCLIKEAYAVATTDPFDPDSSDCLLWQKVVMQELQDYVNMPKCIDFVEDGLSSFLITEFIEGEKLPSVVDKLTGGKKWRVLDSEIRIQLLKYYLEIVDLIERIHFKGYVHRDITAERFLIKPSEEMMILDAAIAYSLDYLIPEPPFMFGTFGYAAPEQNENKSPTIKEDIYSLGAVFIFMTTGIHPQKFISIATLKEIERRLSSETEDHALSFTISRCFSPKPEDRPELSRIKYDIVHALHELLFSHEQRQA